VPGGMRKEEEGEDKEQGAGGGCHTRLILTKLSARLSGSTLSAPALTHDCALAAA